MGASATQPTIIPPRAMFKTGTYVGNQVDNRDIDIGVNLAAKNNVYLIIKSEDQRVAVHRIEYGQGDLTMDYPPGNDFVNTIQTFTATGFQIGGDLRVNATSEVFRYIAFWEEP